MEYQKCISNTVVCDAFFSKIILIKYLFDYGFHIISRFSNDMVLFYPIIINENRKIRLSKVICLND